MTRYHEGLSVHGALTAVGLRPHGIPRRDRPRPGVLLKQNADHLNAALDAMVGWQVADIARQPRAERLRRAWRVSRLKALVAEWKGSALDARIRLAVLGAPDPDRVFALALAPNLIVNAGEAFLVDAWQNLVELENMRFHGVGTGATAAAEGDTALGTESTTILNPDNTRATGSLTEASASVFRTVGTNTFDGSGAITEWGLFTQAATGGGTLFSRVVFSAINVANLDSLQTTWDLTVE